MKAKYNLRVIAAKIIEQVIDHGQSLSNVLPEQQNNVSEKDRSLLQEICFGCMRVLPELDWLIKQLMAKEMKGKQRILHYLIMVGIYQLIYTRIPPHAAVGETVNGAMILKRPQLKSLINGVLRQFMRQQAELKEQFKLQPARFLHPEWLLNRLKKAYPQQWQSIIEENNHKPPMWLRVNRQHHNREQYLNILQTAGISGVASENTRDAIRLINPVAVSALPGFEQGWVTVQDVSAQICTHLLQPENGEFILDLCAAPGGKTTHILENAPNAHVLAIDNDCKRLHRISENLVRLNLHAEVKQGDGRTPEDWIEQQQFDRILLDAPCSATGVIRRHPDIKWLRRDEDINNLVQVQCEILNAIWPYLKSKGVLVYATCSVLPDENCEQIMQFLTDHQDASLVETGDINSPGWQILPTIEGGDGFFYAKLVKM